MENILIVFQKNIELGKVKTRLAATIGDTKALQVYLKLIGYTKKVIDPLSSAKQIWYSSWIEMDDVWDSNSYEKYKQLEGDLGERISFSFKTAFHNSQVKKIIIIGTDCAEITTSLINEAFVSLRTHDFVVGPALDGGFYLLGMNKFYPEIFHQVEWSTDTVFLKIVHHMNTLNKSIHILPSLNDIDTFEDWEKVKHQFEHV
jgi:rSAM/selenodomain-associated transferase 1